MTTAEPTPTVTAAIAATAAAVAISAVTAPVAEAGPANTAMLKPDAVAVQEYVMAHYPEIRTIGGWRQDRYPDHPSGCALDIMVPGWDTPEGRALGDRIADDLLGRAGQLGIKSIIWQQEYRTPDGQRSRMASRGSATQNHLDHLHVLTVGSAGTGVQA